MTLADSIQQFFYTEYNDVTKYPNKPDVDVLFLSNSWYNDMDISGASPNDLDVGQDQTCVRFRLGDSNVTAESHTVVYSETTIYIDIYGYRNADDLVAIQRRLDNILLANISKRDLDGVDYFDSFGDFGISWERIHEDAEVGIVEQIAGELTINICHAVNIR